MRPLVHVVDQPEYDVRRIAAHAARLLSAADLKPAGRSVLLKPSFVYPARPPRNRGVNTQPEFVAGVARALRELGAARIMVAEDCLVGPSQSGFHAMGVLPLLRNLAEPVYLQDEPRVEVRVERPFVEAGFRMPRCVMEADLLISLPKIKVNMYTLVSLSVKNHVGLLLAADRLSNHHYNIHKKIADLYRTRLPDYVLVDAITAGQGQGPMHCDPAQLGLIVGSANGPAADAVCCALMGFDPAEVEHLRLLAGLGLGELDLRRIDIQGAELIAARKRELVRPRCDFADLDPCVRVFCGSELCCVEGCSGMIRGSLDPFGRADAWKRLAGINFIVGKPVKDLPADLDPRRTLVIGDCAAEHADRGKFLPGCPIPPIALTYEFLRHGILVPNETRVRDLAAGVLQRALRLKR